MDLSREAFIKAEEANHIPKARRLQGQIRTRVWETSQLPKIGERYGFLKPQLAAPQVLSVFTAKGGVLKTTIAYNLARTAALHNVRTIVVGLDFQGDISAALGCFPRDEEAEAENHEDLSELLSRVTSYRGLSDIFKRQAAIEACIEPTDIPTLDVIPETPELTWLDGALTNELVRGQWLKDHVIKELKKRYDLIVLDCSPNWSQLTTNALVVADVLLSPIECGITQFRNLDVFRALIEDFCSKLHTNPGHIFVPTKLRTRKVSAEIKRWYAQNVPGVTSGCIRDSTHGEQAMIDRLGVIEYAPKTVAASEMRELALEVWSALVSKSIESNQHDATSEITANRKTDENRAGAL